MCKNIKTKHIPGAEQTPCMQVRERTRDYIPKYRAILSHYTTGCGNTYAAPGICSFVFFLYKKLRMKESVIPIPLYILKIGAGFL